jgi:hypothetical protein
MEKKWKRFGRKNIWPYHRSFLDGLRKTTEVLSVTDIPAEIRNEHVSNTSRDHFQ